MRAMKKNRLLCFALGPGSMRGYRGIWLTLKTSYGITVSRDRVMELLREIDPEGTERRKARRLRRRVYKSAGPNDVWHADGYDKLKPYGFPIHGAVDGFSRRILWLNVTRSNNNPIVHGYFYIKTVQKFLQCPRLLRTYCGTENGLAASIQCKLLSSMDAVLDHR